MISVIIAYTSDQLRNVLEENIRYTIGVPYEIVWINNSSSARGLCEIYNEGSSVGKYEVQCFLHQDIEILSLYWGERVMEAFQNNKKLGLLGIAGSTYKSLAPTSWYCGIGAIYVKLLQGYKHSKKEDAFWYSNPTDKYLAQVATIDGCWMCTKKSIVKMFPFDDEMLKGFHGYDLDFSLSVGRNYTVAVTFEIYLKHHSEGVFDAVWWSEIVKVHKKWMNSLPVVVGEVDVTDAFNYEIRMIRQIDDIPIRRYFRKSLKNLKDRFFPPTGHKLQTRHFI